MDAGRPMTRAKMIARRMVRLVPANWLDPLLTGPKAVIGKPPYYCPDIERLLNAVKERLRKAGVK